MIYMFIYGKYFLPKKQAFIEYLQIMTISTLGQKYRLTFLLVKLLS